MAFKIIGLIVQFAIIVSYALLMFWYKVPKIIYEEISDGIANGYNEFIEKQQVVADLDSQLKALLAKVEWCAITPDKKLTSLEDCTRVVDFQGERFLFDLRSSQANRFVLYKNDHEIADQNRAKNEQKNILNLIQIQKDTSPFIYYEVEVSYLHDMSKLILGYIDFKELESMEEF